MNLENRLRDVWYSEQAMAVSVTANDLTLAIRAKGNALVLLRQTKEGATLPLRKLAIAVLQMVIFVL